MEIAIDSCVQGHHVSKTFWSPTLGEKLLCERESGNPTDPYAVAVLNDTTLSPSDMYRERSQPLATSSSSLDSKGTLAGQAGGSLLK